MDPRYVLLDEPFAGVDPISVGEIRSIVATLKARGIGVLITDHNVRETLAICDRATILAQGRTLAEGTRNRSFLTSRSEMSISGISSPSNIPI